MSKLKLTYFDFPGGRGEVARLIMMLGNIPFEDERISFEEHGATIKERPFEAVPVLEVDGRLMTQSNTINRYLGKMADLYPNDNLQAALCDEIMSAVEDLTHMVVATFQMEDDEKKVAREALTAGPLTTYLKRFEQYLKDNGGQYFADNRLTIADLKMYVWVTGLRNGVMDHIPADIVETIAPLLNEHYERIHQNPKIADYYLKFNT
ncbi:MAG: glutathione S-transferase [Cocleimonas sp.]|jgi:glutathione S-transferase